MSEPVTKSGKMEAVIIKYEQPENNELVRIATVQKASQQQEVKTIGIEGVLYPPFAYQDLAGLYGKNQYHDRCMIVKAACTCGLGFTIEAINPDDEKNKENDPEYKILKEFIDRHPKYAHQPFAETLNCLEMDSEMSGDMYLEVVRNNKGDISEVYHMPFAEMLIKYDQSQKNLNGRTGRQTLIQWLAPNAVEFEEFGAKKKKPDGTYIS
jgi:capsid portal protein